MWLLTNDAGKRMYLRIPEIVKIGRKQANITIQNDTSISRLHAVITVKCTNGLKNDNVTSLCTLRDSGSKYGTFLIENDKATEIPKDGYVLKDKDKIRFGLQDAIFTVTYIPFITLTSRLSANDQCHLEVAMEKIDGVITHGWSDDCTHLTVTTVTFTEKTVCALAFGMYIVNVEYWHAVREAVEKCREIPDAELYTPQLTEPDIDKDTVSLAPNKDRRSLFAGLTFVFFDAKQYKTYGRIILIAGGNSILFARRPLEIKKLCALNIIVMSCEEGGSQSQSSQFSGSSQDYQMNKEEYAAVCEALNERSRRTVPVSEIALAVLHCSREKYCNPRFFFKNMLKSSQRTSDKFKKSNVVALDTQDVSVDISPRQLAKIVSEIRIRRSENSPHLVSESLENDCVPETVDTCDTPTSPVEYAHPTNIKTLLVNKDVYDQLKNAGCTTSTPLPTNDTKKRLRPMSSDEEPTVTPVRGANFATSTPLCDETVTKRAKTTLVDKETVASPKSAMDVNDTINFARPQESTTENLAPHHVVNEKGAGETLIGKDKPVVPPKTVIFGSSGDDECRETSKTLADKNTTHVPSKDAVFTSSTPLAKTNHDTRKTSGIEINTLVTSVKDPEFITSTPLLSMNHDEINSPLMNNADFITSTPLPINGNENNPSKVPLRNNLDSPEKNAGSNKHRDQFQSPREASSPDRVENKGSDDLAEPANASGRNRLSGSTSSPAFDGWIDATARPFSPKTILNDMQADMDSSSEKASTPTAVRRASPARTSPAKASTISSQHGTMRSFLRSAPGRKTFQKVKVPVPRQRICFFRSFTDMASPSTSTHSAHSIHSSHASYSSDSD